ncbi:hypothetical protein MIMGU_mgv11b015718mg, partial [Erythranthe guttata]
MQGNNGQSSSGEIPAKPEERPPVSKKFKTTTSSSDDSQTPPHFPGPLFPAVRRLSPTPSFNSTTSSSSSSTTTTTSPRGGGNTTTSDAFSFNFSDRDYVFPSNLGPYSTRRSVTVKSPSPSSSFPKSHQPPPQFPARSTSMPPTLSSTVGPARGHTAKPKLKSDNDLKTLSFQPSVSTSLGLVPASSIVPETRDSSNSSTARENSGFRHSWKVYM